MVGKCFLDFCHPDDREVVRNHFTSTLRDSQNISGVYRMTGLVGNNNGSVHQRLNNVLHVQTKSIYHKSVNHGGPGINTGLIQSIHSIVGDVPTHISGGSSTAAVTGSTTTNYLTVSNDPNRPQTAVVMMASSVMPAKVSTLSSLLTAGSSTAATGSIGSNRKANSSTPSSSSPSPSNENSEEAKNQLLKQLLNTNYQHSSSSDGQDSSRYVSESEFKCII